MIGARDFVMVVRRRFRVGGSAVMTGARDSVALVGRKRGERGHLNAVVVGFGIRFGSGDGGAGCVRAVMTRPRPTVMVVVSGVFAVLRTQNRERDEHNREYRMQEG